MLYISTRGAAVPLTSAQAIQKGLAEDGGLYLPERLPFFSAEDLKALLPLSYPQRAARILSRFLPDYTEEELFSYAEKAYAGFAPVIRSLSGAARILELYHGPTCAFKDYALQMLPYLLTGAMRKNGEDRTVVILTATSGDTGKAALEGFADVPGTKIAVFYPEGGTSRIQQLQMTTQEGSNVAVFAVKGNFDDAQTGVKRLFSDPALAKELAAEGFLFSSANSINWGRLAPQIVYYVSAYLDLVQAGDISLGDPINIVVPTGNFGNILAACLAKRCGLPFARFLCASNRNNVLTDFLRTGTYDANRPFYLTASPSMDILVSSNLERLLYLLSGDAEQVRGWMQSLSQTGSYTVDAVLKDQLHQLFYAGCADDPACFETIRRAWAEEGYLMDPHTAVACRVYEDYVQETGDRTPSLIASTASPFKFPKSVLEALQMDTAGNDFTLLHRLEEQTGLAAPSSLASLETRRERFTGVVAPNQMKEAIRGWLG